MGSLDSCLKLMSVRWKVIRIKVIWIGFEFDPQVWTGLVCVWWGEAIKLRCQLKRDRYSYMTDMTLFADKCTPRPFVLIAWHDIMFKKIRGIILHGSMNNQ